MPVLTKINRSSLATGVVGTVELADGTIAAVDLATGAALANLADDSITIAKMGTMMSVGETAPTGPFIGQQWYRASTGVTYQYTNDGTSSFWLDVSSGGIGTSASKSVDFVGDVDPHKALNSASLAVGDVYYNKTKNKHFICTDATTDANVWSGKYDAWGGVTTDYTYNSVTYRIHTFKSSDIFATDAMSVDILLVGGGGGGSAQHGGGGGAGALVWAPGYSLTSGNYSITIGDGGSGGTGPDAASDGATGGDTTFGSITDLTADAGGGAGGYTAGAHSSHVLGKVGGSAGGTGQAGSGTTAKSDGTGGLTDADALTAGRTSPNVYVFGGDGGLGVANDSNAGGGGGGAGGNGGNADGSGASSTTGIPGAGGAGKSTLVSENAAATTALLKAALAGTDTSNAATTSSTSTTIYIAGGGGGGSYGDITMPNPSAGVGGGGAGKENGAAAGDLVGDAGLANTGSGGGAGNRGTTAAVGGQGGSGIVIIRYVLT